MNQILVLMASPVASHSCTLSQYEATRNREMMMNKEQNLRVCDATMQHI